MPFEDIKKYPIGSMYSVRTPYGKSDKFRILGYIKISQAKHLYLLEIVHMAFGSIVNPYSLGFWNYSSRKQPSVIGRQIALLIHRDGYVLDKASAFYNGRISAEQQTEITHDATIKSLLRRLSK